MKFALLPLILLNSLSFAPPTLAQSSPCHGPPGVPICKDAPYKIYEQLLLKQIDDDALHNKPEDARPNLQSLMDLYALKSLCDPKASCKDLSHTTETPLQKGWKDKYDVSVFGEAGKCMVSITHFYEKGKTSIMAPINRKDGRLIFKLPSSECPTQGKEVSRSTVVSERGVIVADISLAFKRNPGKRLVFSKLKAPEFSITEDGKAKISMTQGIYFTVDPELDRITDSSLLEPEMYDPAKCKTLVQDAATNYPPMMIKPEMKKTVAKTFVEFGSEKEEKTQDAYFKNVPREE